MFRTCHYLSAYGWIRCWIYVIGAARCQVMSNRESFGFGSSLFNYIASELLWPNGRNRRLPTVVVRVCLCKAELFVRVGSVSLPLPCLPQGVTSRNTLSLVIPAQDGRRNSLFIHLLESWPLLFCGGKFTGGFCSMQMLVRFLYYFLCE